MHLQTQECYLLLAGGFMARSEAINFKIIQSNFDQKFSASSQIFLGTLSKTTICGREYCEAAGLIVQYAYF